MVIPMWLTMLLSAIRDSASILSRFSISDLMYESRGEGKILVPRTMCVIVVNEW